MKLEFTGKTAIVAGASGGMGLATAEKLLQNNISTLLLDVNSPPDGFLQKYSNVTFYQIDLTDFESLTEIVETFYQQRHSIDYLVNTTGVLWFGKDVSVVDIDPQTWDQVFNINLKSMVFLTKLVAPKMVENNFGAMVHISSIDALSGDDKPQDAYGASKAAMIRLSKSIAIQFSANNVRSNVILPGPTETPMQDRWKENPEAKKQLAKLIPLQRIGQSEDIANGVMYLLSDQSQYVTGTELIIDGGLTARP